MPYTHVSILNALVTEISKRKHRTDKMPIVDIILARTKEGSLGKMNERTNDSDMHRPKSPLGKSAASFIPDTTLSSMDWRKLCQPNKTEDTATLATISTGESSYGEQVFPSQFHLSQASDAPRSSGQGHAERMTYSTIITDAGISTTNEFVSDLKISFI